MNEARAEMPIFTKLHDFLAWLIPLTNHFPKTHRQTVTRRLVDAALDLQESLLEANSLRGQLRLQLLTRADAYLNKVRHYLRLVHDWRWINLGQYEHASRLITELGRLLGGWKNVTTKT